jgi:ADP-L-glycero-D-manno-heptose 6-epimerase
MILVTGGAGFIGSNLVKHLCNQGKDVAVVDHLGSEGKWRNLQDSRVWKFYAPEEIMHALTAMPEAVVHLGAISSTTATNADQVIKTNFTLSWHIWDWCRQHKRPFIYASSAATYGDGNQGFDDDHSQLHLLKPLNLYGWSKHQFDQKVIHTVNQHKETPPQWVGLKFFNVYGPRECHKLNQASVMWHFYHRVQQDQGIHLFKSTDPLIADGEQSRDFVYVDDVTNVIDWFLQHPEHSGIYNVGTGRSETFQFVAETVRHFTKPTAPISFVNMPDELLPIYQNHTQANISKLQGIGYNSMWTSVYQGVEKYCQWLSKTNRN